MKFRLFPQERAGLVILTGMAEQIAAGVHTLSEVFGSGVEEYARLAEEVRNYEGESNNLQYALLTHLRSSFISTLPREDTYELGRLLHEAMESVSAAADMLLLYKIDRLPRRLAEILETIARQAELTVNAMTALDDLDGLEDYWIEVLRLAKRARSTNRTFLSELLGDVKPITYIKNREFSNQLMQITNCMHAFAAKVGAVIVKES